ncbi:hypothetical protein AXF42_Ash010132 [Apostasia shenzhenica]|uniref:Uncharacterized protein n=1 Tax=Apostasia shenzhenica TaxID=1088818 RepID=A0A2I0A9L4_9ASPA|nr:hypothetical protein AXF42_Ash010132 [Apostasia shenzhenica]
MRGLSRFAATPGCTVAVAAVASGSSSHPFSTFSGAGGRGRGRGSGSHPISPEQHRVPGQRDVAGDDEEDPISFAFGQGRGRSPLPATPDLPSFSSLISSLKPSASAGRGRGRPASPPPPDHQESQPKKPIFFRQSDPDTPPETTEFDDPKGSAPLPSSLSPILTGSGRGKPTRSAESDSKRSEENRHIRNRDLPIGQRSRLAPSQPKLGRDEAVRKAVDILSRGGPSGPAATGRGGRGMIGRGRGRGRGVRFGGGRGRRDTDEEFELYLGDNADGEKLEKRLGEEKMKILAEEFEEMSWRVLPSPIDEAYLDALHTNNLIEYEPEYLMEFDRNPDIDEKPPMSLEEVLATVKPFLMAYEGIKTQEEWEEAVKDIMEKLPYMKELIDMYSGPDRVTAKQQQQELERVARTLPENVPSSVKRFTDRAVLSLQSNPGWGFDKKCQFMDKLVWEVSQHYK